MKKFALALLAAIPALALTAVLAFAAPSAEVIRQVQTALNEAGFDCGNADGIAGPKTADAVKRYQEAKGLAADGQITDALLEAMGIDAQAAQAAGGALPAAAQADPDFYNLLIIGSDRGEDTSWNGNSDSIILVTLNKKVRKIFLTSFMRDLRADIPGRGYNKINNSYAVGGADLLVDTLTSNFGVRVDSYAAVDWADGAAIIDAFGGVDIEIADYEVEMVNSHAGDVARRIGYGDYEDIYSAGMHHLNGAQAIGYSRIRKVGNNDYERTERQRKVLTALLSNLEFDNTAEIMARAAKALAVLDHNINLVDLLALLSQYKEFLTYEIVTERIPFDGMYSSQSEMLVPEQPATNDRLLSELYAG